MKFKAIHVLIFISIFSCKSKSDLQTETRIENSDFMVQLTPEQYQSSGIDTIKLQKSLLPARLKVNGKIEVPPQNKITVSVPMGGYLKSTKLLSGMHVAKGEVIAEIEDAQYIQLQQDYLTAKSQFQMVENEFNRQKELNQSKASSDKVFEASKAAYQNQLILIKSLEQKLLLIGLNPMKLSAETISKSIAVYSPINGFVSSVNANIGKYLTPSDVLFELVNPEDIHLNLTVFEQDLRLLSVGQKLVAYSNADPLRKYNCEIILISQNLTDKNSTEVHCHFEQYDKTLVPGMFMNAEIEIQNNSAVAVNEEAIVHFEGKHYIFVSKGNFQFEMTTVNPGHNHGGMAELMNADQLINKNIVSTGAWKLLMVMKNKGSAGNE